MLCAHYSLLTVLLKRVELLSRQTDRHDFSFSCWNGTTDTYSFLPLCHSYNPKRTFTDSSTNRRHKARSNQLSPTFSTRTAKSRVQAPLNYSVSNLAYPLFTKPPDPKIKLFFPDMVKLNWSSLFPSLRRYLELLAVVLCINMFGDGIFIPASPWTKRAKRVKYFIHQGEKRHFPHYLAPLMPLQT